MIEALPSVVQFAGILLVAAVLSSTLSSVLYAPFRRCISRFKPSTRSLATLCFALIAPSVSLITTLLYLAPEHAQPLVFEHCHGSVCDTHAPVVAAGSFGSLGLLAVALLLVLTFVAGIAYLGLVGRRRMTMLFALGERQRKSNHLILDSDRLFAWCCGLFRQRIVISRALLERLSSEQLELVLAHETAHAVRFDNLRIFSARWLTRLWPAKSRDRFLADLVADGEQSCDAFALRTVPDPSIFQQTGSAGGDHRSSVAYLLVACACAIQTAVAIAASHPIVEAIAAVRLW